MSGPAPLSGQGGTAGLLPGAVLGGWRLERLLARGASGALYVARRADGEPPRALKVFVPPAHLSPAERQEVQAHFMREADLLRTLSHPTIVEVHDAGADAGVAFLVTTLLPGSDLRRHVRPARRLPEPLVLALGADVAEALAHAHARGVVHRDVKPANLVFDAATRRVWLTDFGAARVADGERTRTGVIVGTPAFMPPEQLAGAAPTPAGDVYGLAVTLFQLLTARLPHEGETMGALLQSIARGGGATLRALRPDLPAGLDALLAQALDRDPGARPTATAFAARLRTLAAAVT